VLDHQDFDLNPPQLLDENFYPLEKKTISIEFNNYSTYIPIALFHIILYDESVNVSRSTT
jgi:hypothetical protein